MRGAGDHLSIGERVAFYRARRGLTQAVLANLVGRSEDWLSKIERGEREIRRLDVLTELARALRVTLGDLVGQPVLVEDDQSNDDVPAIRDALMSPQRLSRVLFVRDTRSPDVQQIERLAAAAWDDYQAGGLGRAIAVLPQLITAAQALEGERVRDGWRVSARVHHLAATTLSKVGEADLAWIAAERAMGAADQSDDPLVLASAARAGTHALLSVGRYGDALELGETARSWLADQTDAGNAEALSLLGMLDLRMAIAAARRQDRPTATRLLDRAEVAAGQLGVDANHWQTAFGPTNVALHRISAALDLGDSTYVAEHGPNVDPAPLPVERQVCHHINVARAYSDLAQDDVAVATLLDAERQAPQFVRHNVTVRETVRTIYKRAPVTMGGRRSDVMQFAERCRAI
ncbi:MAG TPA: helix-turn-helix transcriptional regulator [Jiangellaceae bacterium]